MMQTSLEPGDALVTAGEGRGRGWVWLPRALLGVSIALYALHFLHPAADFPHDSSWNDWSKYTDEGWYSDGAIRHFVLGHWFLPGDFNPALAMPVWPLLEAPIFWFIGVSLGAARTLTVAVFGVMLLGLYRLLRGHEQKTQPARPASEQGGTRLAAPLAMLFATASPFLFAFDRLALLEPLLAALTVLVLWMVSRLRPWAGWRGLRAGGLKALGRPIGTGVLLAALVLTKPTAAAPLPAVLFYLWYRAGCRLRSALRLAALPTLVAGAIWGGYFLLCVRPHLEDYRYLFDANDYTGFQLQPLSEVLVKTVSAGACIGPVLYGLFFVLIAAMVLFRPRFFRNGLVPTLLVWIGGYLLLLGYHNNAQPRYYVLIAVPVTALVALALDEVLQAALVGHSRRMRLLGVAAVVACALAVAVPDLVQETGYALHPDYSYLSAARQIAAIVRGDQGQSPLILSVSGSDLTLMTGLPSIDDDFGTLDLDERVRLYRPGWYVAWNQMDDDKMDALDGLYRPVRVAAFPAMDDPDRNLLVLYRLDQATAAAGLRQISPHATEPSPSPVRPTSPAHRPRAQALTGRVCCERAHEPEPPCTDGPRNKP